MSNGVYFSQHYGVGNCSVKDESHKMLASLVIEELHAERNALKILEIKEIIVNE